MMAHDVFISYSNRDKAVADAVCATLEERGIRCWYAPRDVPAGGKWASALVDAIGDSRVFVLVFSDGSNRSEQVSREVAQAAEGGLPILPLRIEDVEPVGDMRFYIQSIHWLDALTPPLERHLHRLAASVEALLSVAEMPEGRAVTRATVADRFSEQVGEPRDRTAREAARDSGERELSGRRSVLSTPLIAAVLALVLVSAGMVWALTGILGSAAPTPAVQPSVASAGFGETPAATRAATERPARPGVPASATAPVLGQEPVTTEPSPKAAPTEPAAGPGVVLSVSKEALLEAGAKCLAWSPDGQVLAAGDFNIAIYDVSSLEETALLRAGHTWALAFSPDGRVLASAHHDGVRLWDAARSAGDGLPSVGPSWAELGMLSGTGNTWDVAFSPDGTKLATATGGTVKIWSVEGVHEGGAEAAHELRTIPAGGTVLAVAVSPDGRLVAAATGAGGVDLALWQLSSGEVLHTLKGNTSTVKALAFSPDGALLYAGAADGMARAWEIALGRQMATLSGHAGQVSGLALSPDGAVVATASMDLTVRLWFATTGLEVETLTGHTGWVNAVAFSLAGRNGGMLLASGSHDGVRLWRIGLVGDSEEPATGPTPIVGPVGLGGRGRNGS